VEPIRASELANWLPEIWAGAGALALILGALVARDGFALLWALLFGGAAVALVEARSHAPAAIGIFMLAAGLLAVSTQVGARRRHDNLNRDLASLQQRIVKLEALEERELLRSLNNQTSSSGKAEPSAS
jgi:membrane protein implicated in regulation of membrane protease activity